MKDPKVGKARFFFQTLPTPRVITGANEKFEFEKKKLGAFRPSNKTEKVYGTGVWVPEFKKNKKKKNFLSYSGQGQGQLRWKAEG